MKANSFSLKELWQEKMVMELGTRWWVIYDADLTFMSSRTERIGFSRNASDVLPEFRIF